MVKNILRFYTIQILLILPFVLVGCGMFPAGSRDPAIPAASPSMTLSEFSTQVEPTAPPTHQPALENVLTPTSKPIVCDKVPAPQLSETNPSKDIYLSGIVDFCLLDTTQTAFDFDKGILGNADDNLSLDMRPLA